MIAKVCREKRSQFQSRRSLLASKELQERALVMNGRGCCLPTADRPGRQTNRHRAGTAYNSEMILTAKTQCSDSFKGDLVCLRVRMPDRESDYVRGLGCRQVLGNSWVMCSDVPRNLG